MEVIEERYELRGTLGVGGMAEVREAYDRVLDRRVAIKLLRSDLGRDASVRQRFLQEARTAAQFTHPNAVTVFDTGVAGNRPFIVMELVEGPTLADRLRDGPLPEGEAVQIADEVLAALAAAHLEGFVHRDVKPGNILLPTFGGVKLADFGIAKSVQDATAGLTLTGTIIGTPAYLSPEQVNGEPATPRSDVYAMGVVVYEMLTGVQPYTGDSPVAVAVAHTTRPVPSLRNTHPTVGIHLAEIVERAMAKDPDARYPDAAAMRDALLGRESQRTAVLPPAGAATTQVVKQRPFERTNRRTPAVIPLILVALLVLAGLALALASGDEPRARRQRPAQDTAQAGAEQPVDQATEPPQPTEAPQPTEPEPEPAPDPGQANDVPSLITLLAENPEAYGAQQEELRKRLEELARQEDPAKVADQATKLIEQVETWASEGSITPELAAATSDVLTPLTFVADEDDEGEGEGEGNGEAKGKGKGRKDD